MEKPETPLQRFVRMAIEQAPHARDYFDKQIQSASGTKGKPLYDLSRGKGLNPGSQMLKHMAAALGQPVDLIRRAAEDELVEPIPWQELIQRDVVSLPPASLDEIAAEHDLALIEEVDLAYGMGGTFLDAPPEVVGMVPFRLAWLREMYRGPLGALKVVRGSGDSMQPTIHDGDVILVNTSKRRIDDQDRLWAITYGDIGMIRRLRQLPSGGVLMQPDNAVVRPSEAYDGEMSIVGRVIWIGKRM